MCVSSVFVLSLDIVLHPQLGDLSNPQAIARWQDLILLGILLFVMAGPPCETWSAARFLKLGGDGHHGPRPLRSQQQLWGLTCLRKSEANSISIGNALLRATIRMFFAALCSPATGVIMEHPRKPSWMPQAPSSWLLPELEYFADLPNCEAHHVDQCMLGAPNKKPTTLLCLQVKCIHILKQTPTTCDQQHQHATTLRGVDDNELFRTAPAKQYPRGMCSLLAKLAHGQFLAACRAMPPPPPLLEEFAQSVLAQFYIPTDPYLEAQSFGADLSGHTGTYRSLPPLPNGKEEALDEALYLAGIIQTFIFGFYSTE